MGCLLLLAHVISLEVTDIIKQFRVHGQLLAGDLLGILKVLSHVVLFIIHHRIFELRNQLALYSDQVGFVLHALQVIVKNSLFSLKPVRFLIGVLIHGGEVFVTIVVVLLADSVV